MLNVNFTVPEEDLRMQSDTPSVHQTTSELSPPVGIYDLRDPHESHAEPLAQPSLPLAANSPQTTDSSTNS